MCVSICVMLFCIYFSQYAKLRDYNEAITMKILLADQENVYYKFNHSYTHIFRLLHFLWKQIIILLTVMRISITRTNFELLLYIL